MFCLFLWGITCLESTFLQRFVIFKLTNVLTSQNRVISFHDGAEFSTLTLKESKAMRSQFLSDFQMKQMGTAEIAMVYRSNQTTHEWGWCTWRRGIIQAIPHRSGLCKERWKGLKFWIWIMVFTITWFHLIEIKHIEARSLLLCSTFVES